MVNNPNFYGQSTHLTPNQIEDGVDFPHTGIVKALSHGLGQNYAISGFNITVDSATQIDVSAGVVFRDGRKLSVLGANNLALSASYTNGYHLLVAPIESDEDSDGSTPDTSTVVLRPPTAADKVPQYTAGDTIIAVITHNGTANVGIQYLTVNKTENSLSVGYDNSGYTEAGSITGPSADSMNFATATVERMVLTKTSNDVSLTIKTDDTADAETATLRLLNARGTDSDFEIIHDAFGATEITSNQPDSGTNVHMKLTDTPAVIINPNAADMDFQVAGDTVSNLIYANAGTDRVGIGTNAPESDLHITSSATGNIFILECTDAGTASGPDISMIRNSASPAANDFLGRLVFKGKDAGGNIDEYANIKTQLLDATAGSEDIAYYFQGLIAGTNRPFLGLKGTGGKNGSGAEACINEHGIDMDFRVEANGQTEALFVQGSDGKVGINNNAPSVELDITGSGKFSSNLEIDGALNHDGSTAGFFGATPITKITVGNIAAPATINPDVPNSPTAAEITSTQAAILALENKLDAVIDALQALGLIA